VTGNFKLGPWLVQPGLNTVFRDGISTHVSPKVMGVLVCLAQNAGESVSKERLLKTIWPDTFVGDDVLKVSISDLRRVLEDDARDPRFIQTIPKCGYRLLSPVDSVEAAAVSAPSLPSDSVVVLPFINMSADPEDEFFADGVTEEIINALAQIKDLRVVARSSAFSFKGKQIDPRVVGEQLKVRTLLEGSVRRAGTRLRITALLVNALDGYHLWSERYDRELQDVFEIQDEIARSIAERLKVTLRGEQEPLVKAGTENLRAYQLYVKGRALLYRRGPAFPAALDFFKQAVAFDSQYAAAWAGMADAYTLSSFYGFMHPESSRPKWQEAVNRAVAADPSLAEARTALALGSLFFEWDKGQAEREFVHALELNPGYIQARDWYAIFFLQAAVGRLPEGVEHAKQALDSDPLSCYAHCVMGLTYAGAKRYDEAVQSSERAVELDGGSFLARWTLQTSLYFSGQLQASVAAGEAALAMSGRHPTSVATLALTFADLGKMREAEAVYAELLARGRQGYVPPSTLVAAAAAAQQPAAIRHVSEVLAIRDPFTCLILSSHWPYGRRVRMNSDLDEMLREGGID
jgi:adenylate cyclase